MSSDNYQAIQSMDDLFIRLEEKYSNLPGYRSSSRFPSLLIFFDRKDDYVEFIGRCPYKKVFLQDFVNDGRIISKEMCDRWLKHSVELSKREVITLLPISELIRLRFLENKERMCDYVFGRILESEDSQMVVPIPDFLNEYKLFFETFEHNTRCGETWYLSKCGDNNEERLKIFVDHKGLIEQNDIDKNSHFINNLVEWLDIWSGSGLQKTKKIIIRDPNLIEPILSRGIAVPTVDIYDIQDERKYLSTVYGMSDIPDFISLNSNEWNLIIDFVRRKNNRKYSWKRLNDDIIGNTHNSPLSLITEYWNESNFSKRELERCLWLAEAKNQRISDDDAGSIIRDIIGKVDTSSQLLDVIYKDYLTNSSLDPVALKQRRDLFQSFRSGYPHFEAGEKEIEDFFNKQIEAIPLERRWEYLTGHFHFEKKYLVRILTESYSKYGCISNDLLIAIKSIWKPLYHYISTVCEDNESTLNLVLSMTQHELTEPNNFQLFLKCYMIEYVKSKLMDNQTKILKSLQEQYFEAFKEILAKTNMGILRGLNNENTLNEIRRNKLILLDAVGIEWKPVLIGVLEEHEWSLSNDDYNLAVLPSITNHCPLNKDLEKAYREYDELVHTQYRYPETIYDEIDCVVQITERLVRDFKNQDYLTIVSDHGATAFARKGDIITLEANEKHGGRYAIAREGKLIEINNRSVYSIEGASEKAIVMLSTSNINIKPRGEAHGGASLEEIATIHLTFKRKSKMSSQIKVWTEQEYSLLDESIKFFISIPSNSNAFEFEINVNDGPSLRLPMDSIKKSEFSIELSKLRSYGLAEGENVIKMSIVGMGDASCSVILTGAAKNNNFNDLFD